MQEHINPEETENSLRLDLNKGKTEIKIKNMDKKAKKPDEEDTEFNRE